MAKRRNHLTPAPTPGKTAPAFGYVRVSTEEQVICGVSLDAQRAAITTYCRLHGLRLVRIHADEGRSAKRADNRPGLARAIEAACIRKAVLVVHSLSRLARSTRDAIDITERLDHAGANLVSITERIDTTTGIGRFFFTTVAALAQLERDQISERTKAALAHKRNIGQRVSSRISFGFDLGKDGSTLIPNRAEQRMIGRIVKMYAVGISTRVIITELDRLGVAPKYGKRWHPKTIMDVVRRGSAND